MAGGRNGSWKETSYSLKVKKKLLTRGMTITELANEIKVNQSYLSQVIYGIKPGWECIRKVNAALGMKEEAKQAAGE